MVYREESILFLAPETKQKKCILYLQGNHVRAGKDTEKRKQKKEALQTSFFEPLVGFEPTTPRLQITCSGQLS